MALYYEALERPSEQLKTQRRLLDLAQQKLEDSIRSLSTNDLTLFQLGNVFRMMAKKEGDGYHFEELIEKAVEIFKKLSQRRMSADLSFYVQLMWAKCLYRKGKKAQHYLSFDEARSLCEKALETMPDNSELLLLLVSNRFFFFPQKIEF